MKVVILAGGLGTRMQEETAVKPKAMIEIGGRPILWHIMKIYSHFGFNEFIIALGYKSEWIKKYFLNYTYLDGDLCVKTGSGKVESSSLGKEDWVVHLVDTGMETQTGGRLKRIQPLIGNEPFLMTYSDAVADIDILTLVAHHRKQGRLVTLTAVRPEARFGALVLEGDSVREFKEKNQLDEGWINGGFFVMEPQIFKHLNGDESVLELSPLTTLAASGQLSAYQHSGFWKCMDTLRDVRALNALWDNKVVPWKMWETP